MKNNYKGALPVGSRLSGESFTYEIEKVLGQGSFGITYLAHIIFEGKLGSLKKIKQLVAIKEFYMCDINSRNESQILEGSSAETFKSYHQRFRKEAENLSKMDHPGIVDVMEIFEANGTSYYVMDFLQGGTLLEHIKERGKLPSKEALQLILKICEALGYMHAQRMLHLDLKPSNIGMTETKEPVLIDFGLSKVFTENGMPESTTGIGGGTPGYSPLEQMNYNPKNGLALTLDIYALGGTLFKALTGMNPPYATMLLDDDDALTSRMIESKVSPEVMELVTWAMSPRKKDRPQNVETFSERARCILEDLRRDDKDSACEINNSDESIDTFSTEELISSDVLGKYEHYDKTGFKGLVRVKKNGLWGYLDFTGREIIPCIYSIAYNFYDGLAMVSKNKMSGYIDVKGKEIIPLIHQSIGMFGNFDDEIIEAGIGNKRGYYNRKGEIVIPFEYEKAFPFSEGLAPVRKNGKWGFVDSGNHVVIPFIYEEVWSFTEGLAMAKLNDKWGFIDKTTRIIVPFEYDEVNMYDEGIASVKKNGKWGCVDKSGKLIVPCEHDSSHFSIEKEEDDEYRYMNAKENHLYDPSFERSFIPVHHFEDIHGFRCRLDYSLYGDKRNALERLLSDMSTNVLPDSQVHYHPICRPEIDTIQYGRNERTGLPGIFFTTHLHDWIENLEFLRSTTGLPFRFGTPDEVLEYARMLKDGALTWPVYMHKEMFALDPVSSKFSIVNLTIGESSTFNLNALPKANILLVCDVMRSPLEGINGFDEIQSFGYAFFKRPNNEGCDILDNQMNALRISPSFDYDVVWHEQYGLYDNPPKSGMPLYKNGEPYIGNIFYIREDERETSKWPEICHIGPGMKLVPGMMEVSEDTDPYEK